MYVFKFEVDFNNEYGQKSSNYVHIENIISTLKKYDHHFNNKNNNQTK